MKRDYIKRLVSTVTSIVMIFSCLTGMITASAVQQSFTLVEGSITATLNDNGVFTVTGKGEMPDYGISGSDCPYNDKKTNITSVVINSDITTIGKFNFSKCTNITNVDIAETVTKINQSAFLSCTGATIDIKGKLTAANIGTAAFGSTTANYVKKIIVHDQGTFDVVKSKTGNGKVEIELKSDAGSLKTELQNLINDTKTNYKQENYTEASYKTLSDALKEAEALVGKDSPSTEEIQNATTAINDAINKLVPIIDGLKSEINLLITEAENKISTNQLRSQYTTSSLAALDKAIADAKDIVKKSDATKEALSNAKTALEEASKIDDTGLAETGLKVKVSNDAWGRLTNALKNLEPSEKYTLESYDKYKEAYDKLVALSVKTSNDITDQQVDAVIAELNAAKEQLVPVEINLNTKEYETIKKEIEDILNNDNSPYTENSLRGATNSLTSIYNFQLSFVEDKSGKIKDGVLQSQIDSATNILKKAIDLESDKCILVEKGDLTNLKTLVESTKELTEANYTAETWTALSDELTKANALINDPDNAAKADVEASEKALKAAIDALKYKSADYKAVDDALAKVPSDLSKYTDETVKALQNAINAVDKNKNITEQADVDAFAKAIENAIAGLKLKPASISKTGTSGKSSAVKSAAQLKAEKAMNQAKITKLTVKSKAKKTIVVKWNKVKNAKGYQVQISTKRNFKKLIVNKKSVKKNKITVKNKKLKKGKKYFVRVRAYATYKNSKGVTKKAYSSWNKKLRTVKIK